VPNDPNGTKTYRRAGRRIGDVFERWRLTEFVKAGGNGDVWFVESEDGDQAAMKILHRLGDEDYERFRREVATCKEIADLTRSSRSSMTTFPPSRPSVTL